MEIIKRKLIKKIEENIELQVSGECLDTSFVICIYLEFIDGELNNYVIKYTDKYKQKIDSLIKCAKIESIANNEIVDFCAKYSETYRERKEKLV